MLERRILWEKSEKKKSMKIKGTVQSIPAVPSSSAIPSKYESMSYKTPQQDHFDKKDLSPIDGQSKGDSFDKMMALLGGHQVGNNTFILDGKLYRRKKKQSVDGEDATTIYKSLDKPIPPTISIPPSSTPKRQPNNNPQLSAEEVENGLFYLNEKLYRKNRKFDT